MTVKLNPEMQEIIESQLKAGAFATAEDVVLAALMSLTQDRNEDFGAPEHLQVRSAEQLNALIAEGERSIEEHGTLDGDEAFQARRARRGR